MKTAPIPNPRLCLCLAAAALTITLAQTPLLASPQAFGFSWIALTPPAGFERIELPQSGHTAINNQGQICGSLVDVIIPFNPDTLEPEVAEYHPFRWTPGVGFETLNTLDLPKAKLATLGINNAGQVFGYAGTKGDAQDPRRVWRYSDDTGMSTLSTPSLIADTFFLMDFSDAGHILGVYDPTGTGVPLGDLEGVRYTDGIGWETLASLDSRLENDSTFYFSPRRINSNGQFIGIYRDDTTLDAVGYRYTNGIGIEILSGPGFDSHFPEELAENGDVICSSVTTDTEPRRLATIFTGTLTTIHDDTAGFDWSNGRFLNSNYAAGVYVGSDISPPDFFLYNRNTGTTTNVSGGTFGIDTLEIRHMNSSGWLTGNTFFNFTFARDWIWSPNNGLCYTQDIVDPGQTTYSAFGIQGLNDNGQFVSYGSDIAAEQGLVFVFSPSCPCDHNADATVDFFDLLDFLDDWFAAAPAADFNDSSSVDFFDLLDFLDCWFTASSGNC